jgi:hypothetical protein
MAYSKVVMGGGTSAGQAAAIAGGVSTAISAAGTTQATATQLYPLGLHLITTCAAGAGVVVTAGAAGDNLVIFNGGANACIVYPQVGAKINSLPTNTGINLAVNTAIELFCGTTGTTPQWIGILSA